MTAVIADTSPLLRKIPSDPLVDTRSFGLSSSPMSFARYLAEGRQQQQRDRQSPLSPHSYGAGQTPPPYNRAYGYSYGESFPYEEPDEPTRIPRSTCRCTSRCTCIAGMPDAPSGSWRKDRTRPGLDADGSPSRPAKTTGPGRAAVPLSGPSRTAGGSKPINSKNSDWEKLLGAVDLELRLQQRGGSQAEGSNSRATGEVAYRALLHPGAGVSRPSAMDPSAVPPMEMERKAKHHRRGGDAAAGGGPAYSGSTADAACLLATLPQRMLEPAIAAPHPGVDIDPSTSPSLVPTVAPPAPVRVQASGRRGPRGQSRFKGVCITRAGKWRAVIYIGRKQKYLGVFDSEYDAARAYDAAAVQHFAEGAKLNFPEGMEQHLRAAAASSMKGGHSQVPLDVCGSGGPAAPRSETPPPFESPSRKRSRKRAFSDGLDDDDEWVRDDVPWGTRR